MWKKALLIAMLPITAFADPIVHENELIIEYADKIQLELAPQSMVFDNDHQSYAPYSLYPMDAWGGVYSEYQAGSPSYKYARYPSGYPTRTPRLTSEVKITVLAPRKNNAKVAKWAKLQQKAIMNGYNKGTVYATVAGGSLARAPEELNFAFIGKLYVYDDVDQFVCDNVVIGQGHSGANNNWWIYSNFWPMNADGTPQKSGYANRLVCEGEGGKLQFLVESSTFSPNTFTLKEI